MEEIPDSWEAPAERQRHRDRDAAYWHIALDDDPSPTRNRRFLRWVQDAKNIEAFLDTAFIYRELKSLPSPSRNELQSLVAEAKADIALNVVPFDSIRVASSAPRQARRRFGFYAGVSTLAMFLFVAFSIAFNQFHDRYTTVLGEQRSFRLSDGSTVYLNTETSIRVHITPHKREIVLSGGEALFVVAPDPSRSFVVEAGGVKVRALGTQFNVYLDRQTTRVDVVDGRVAVNGSNSTVLEAGDSANVNSAGAVAKRRESDSQRVLAWRRRQFDFRAATLEEVSRQFNRYNTTQIHIQDPRLAQLRINGVFSIDEPGVLLAFLAQAGNFELERQGKEVVIRSK